MLASVLAALGMPQGTKTKNSALEDFILYSSLNTDTNV